nr:hypothetical protein [Thermus scotoductus]
MRQGFFALLTADPLRGALRPVEARLLEEARGEALFLVPYPLRDLAEAWRLAYRSLGLKRGRVLYLRRREEAFDPEIAQAVAASPLVLLAAEGLPEFLSLESAPGGDTIAATPLSLPPHPPGGGPPKGPGEGDFPG